VLAAVVAAAGAVAALAPVLGVPWLLLVALAIACIAGASRIAMAIGQGRLERAQEQSELAQRVRVPIGAVRAVDPTEIGVDPAAQFVLGGGTTPNYVGRTVDEALSRAIDGALTGSDRWLIVVTGPSKVGKSRSLFEAVRAHSDGGQMALVAPTSGDSLRSLLMPGSAPRIEGLRPVLWLDDLEPFVAQGVTLETLREWHRVTGMPVLATYGGKGSERVGETAGMRELTELTGTLLQHAREIRLEATTQRELQRLPAGLAPDVRAAIARHGLAAFLVAAPALERKLSTRRHGPGEVDCREGAAIVYAAVDWALCGRTDPIAADPLRRMWRSYVPAGTASDDEAFEAGLAWALRPVAGSISLLRDAGGYLAYDYIVAFVHGRPESVAPVDAAWEAAIDTNDPSQAFAVGVSAWAYEQADYAIAAFEIARRSQNADLAARAGFNLALGVRRKGDVAAARRAFEWVIASAHPDVAPKANVSLGLLLQQTGDLEAAQRAFEAGINAQHPDATPSAFLSLGTLLELLGEEPRARQCYEAALASGHVDPAPLAALQLGALLERHGDIEGARAAYRRALEVGRKRSRRRAQDALERLPHTAAADPRTDLAAPS
jgi:tetratricopeptide (TPR) repeat protein